MENERIRTEEIANSDELAARTPEGAAEFVTENDDA